MSSFYGKALAGNPTIDDFEKDQDGVWRLKPNSPRSLHQGRRPPSFCETNKSEEEHAIVGGSRAAGKLEDKEADMDNCSVSSTNAEAEHEVGSDELGKATVKSVLDSFMQATPGLQPSATVSQLPKQCIQMLIKDIGTGLSASNPQRRSQRLETMSGPYEVMVVEFRKSQADGKTERRSQPRGVRYLQRSEKMKAALNNAWPSSSSEETFQLPVFTHDELSRSNGLVRINDERCKSLLLTMVTLVLIGAISRGLPSYQGQFRSNEP